VGLGVAGEYRALLPKAIISAYSFRSFLSVVGMVKGLRSPDGMPAGICCGTYQRKRVFGKGFWKNGDCPLQSLSVFASLKNREFSAALVLLRFVGELPTGARAGFGAPMLVGDQYGQPPWSVGSALFASGDYGGGFLGGQSLALAGAGVVKAVGNDANEWPLVAKSS